MTQQFDWVDIYSATKCMMACIVTEIFIKSNLQHCYDVGRYQRGYMRTKILTILVVATIAICISPVIVDADSVQDHVDDNWYYAVSDANDFSIVKQNGILVVEDVSVTDTAFYNNLNTAVNNQNLIISYEGTDLFESELYEKSTAFIVGADATATYVDPITGTVYCHSVVCSDSAKTKELMRDWSTAIMNSQETQIVTTSNSDIEWGHEIQSSADIVCEDYGMMNINTNYVEQVTDSPYNRYFKAYYEVQSVPNEARRTADINVLCDVGCRPGQELRSYGPTTTSSTSTASVSLNWGVSTSGPSVSASTGWSYSIPDVSIVDESDYSEDIFSIKHDVDEGKNVGKNTYKVNPGLIASTDKTQDGGSYHVTDVYSIQFAKWLKGFWPWSPEYAQEYSWFEYSMDVDIE